MAVSLRVPGFRSSKLDSHELAAETAAFKFQLRLGHRRRLGFMLYLAMIVAVAFGVQLITYIQHWGLGQDSIPDRVAYGRGWDEDCRFQAWVTLSVSLHDHHHRDSRTPYYRLDLSPDSPRLPAGYVLLMFASLVPPLWQAMMRPALERWLLQPGSPLSAGRRITCFGPARARKAAPG